MSSRLSLSF
uniref:Uncharacterized protein n=1 Tax=Rhizophora mucronata TaxID=61149 RepID=A0A2P2N963_RHIMU